MSFKKPIEFGVFLKLNATRLKQNSRRLLLFVSTKGFQKDNCEYVTDFK